MAAPTHERFTAYGLSGQAADGSDGVVTSTSLGFLVQGSRLGQKTPDINRGLDVRIVLRPLRGGQ